MAGPGGPPTHASVGQDTQSESSSKMDYVQQRYSSKEDFVHFTKEQTEKMLDQVLQSNETVKYLLESMKMVGFIIHQVYKW
jgi:hypothetical protein